MYSSIKRKCLSCHKVSDMAQLSREGKECLLLGKMHVTAVGTITLKPVIIEGCSLTN